MHISIVTCNKELSFYVISFELPGPFRLRLQFCPRERARHVGGKSKEASIFFSDSLIFYSISWK